MTSQRGGFIADNNVIGRRRSEIHPIGTGKRSGPIVLAWEDWNFRYAFVFKLR